MVDDVVGGHFNLGVGSELCEFAIKLLYPLPHGFGEKSSVRAGLMLVIPMASSC